MRFVGSGVRLQVGVIRGREGAYDPPQVIVRFGIIFAMRSILFLWTALAGAGAAFAECGEQYPENRTRGAVYGYEFGVTNRTGLRNQIR